MFEVMHHAGKKRKQEMAKIRTRFAPSPTGRMHVGNLRSALYEFLIAKHDGGDFMLRIEDTDQERFVEGAVDIIYDTLAKAGLSHDEGPDKDGGYGPYVQSERMKTGIYMKYAKELIDKGEAYYCFCDKERLSTCLLYTSDAADDSLRRIWQRESRLSSVRTFQPKERPHSMMNCMEILP